MAPANSPAPSAVDALNSQIDASLAIIQPLEKFVQGVYADAAKLKSSASQTAAPSTVSTVSTASTPSTTSTDSAAAAWDPPTEFDALSLARDAATLARAHGTKISLLMINEPFTPSAIGKVVQELVNGPVPALSKAAEVCYGDRYTNHVRQELARRCGSILVQVQNLLKAIPRDGRVVPKDKRTGGGASGKNANNTNNANTNNAQQPTDRGSYTKIGILWAECDGTIAFCNRGVGGHLVQVVNQLADMLKDEQEELKEWADEEDDEDGDDSESVDDSGYDDGEGDDTDTGGNQHDATQAMLDAMMNTRHIPPDDPDGLRPRLETALKKIRLVVLLCRAVVKRRLNKLPAPVPTQTPSDIAPRLDGAMVALQAISNRFEDLAAAFYKLSTLEVDAAMSECFAAAVSASEQLARPWAEGAASDEFTEWVVRFQSEMRRAAE